MKPEPVQEGTAEDKAASWLKRFTKDFDQAARNWLAVYALALTMGSLIYSIGASSTRDGFARIFATSLGVVGTATLVGGFLGLLFGMPKELPRSSEIGRESRFALNTNLLKVSDWVTTVLVGLSFVNLRSIPGQLDALGDALGPALGGNDSSGPYGICLALASAVAGFLVMYLYTTVTLRSMLEQSAKNISDLVRGVASEMSDQQLDALEASSPEEIRQIVESERSSRQED